MSAAALFPAAAASDRGRIPLLDIGPLFLGPDCVPTCVGPDNPPRYEPTTYGAFAQRLLTLNFAHRRRRRKRGIRVSARQPAALA